MPVIRQTVKQASQVLDFKGKKGEKRFKLKLWLSGKMRRMLDLCAG
ncbi:MAG: hypothetical protein ACYST3_07250 [Planctomycetota bacterium]